MNGLAQRMENASEDLDFERAAHYRDQIASLKAVQEKQFISGYAGDFDVVVWLDATNPMSAAADSKVGILSFWVRLDGGDGTIRYILQNSSSFVRLEFDVNNELGVFMKASGGTKLTRP